MGTAAALDTGDTLETVGLVAGGVVVVKDQENGPVIVLPAASVAPLMVAGPNAKSGDLLYVKLRLTRLYSSRSVSDRPFRSFSAQQETVQRSPEWDWIFSFVVAEMRASGCSVLLS